MRNLIDQNAFNILLGKKIKELREDRGITQEKLAELSSVHENSIKTIELGKINPRIYTLYKISLALNIELEELISQI